MESFGGIPNVIIPEPEITVFRINSSHDFVILGCDGIYDKLTNEDLICNAYQTIINSNAEDNHVLCSEICENILNCAINSDSFDNLTTVVIAFKDLKPDKENICENIFKTTYIDPHKAVSNKLRLKLNPEILKELTLNSKR